MTVELHPDVAPAAPATGDGQIIGQTELVPRPETGPGAACEWCDRPIPATSPDTGRATRKDATTCGKRCRQAKWREARREA
jgi:hypothetical protein